MKAGDFPTASGIYAIIHRASGRRYVGSSWNIRKRIREHLSALRFNRHHSPYLQKTWAKYGDVAFEIAVLELCPVEALIVREQHHMDVQCALNARNVADRRMGVKHTAETKAKISAIRKADKRGCETAGRRLNDPRLRALVVQAVKARLSDPIVRAAAVAAMNTPEAAANRRARMTSPEYRAKQRASHLGRMQSTEVRAKISATRTGLRLSDEVKAARRSRIAAKRAIGGV